MFLQNKYTKWYFSIVENARQRKKERGVYTESHHIIPTACGGDNHPENRVLLFPKEHFICHRLLPKAISNEKHKRSMLYALHKIVFFTSIKNLGKIRYYAPRHYVIARKAASEASKDRTVSIETRLRMSIAKKNLSQETRDKMRYNAKNRVMSDETKAKISASNIGKTSPNKGKTLSEEWKNKLSLATKGITKTEETKKKMRKPKTQQHRENISKGKKGIPNLAAIGRIVSEETKKKISNKQKGIPKPQIKCPHCDKIGSNSAMTRYHIPQCGKKLIII